MLKQTDVLAYWYKQKKYAIHLVNPSRNSVDHKQSFVAVGHNSRLLALCTHPHAAASVGGYTSVIGVGLYSHRMNNQYPEFEFDSDKPWLLRLNANRSGWEASTDFSSIEELAETVLINTKAAALDHLFMEIEATRFQVLGNFDACQGRIYQAKVAEAKEIMRLGLTTDDLMEYPFTSGYARIAGIGLYEAANRIVVKHKMQEAGLAESENLRLRTKQAILSATSMKEVREAFDKYKTELNSYGNL